MAISVSTLEGINTIFPVSAYDPLDSSFLVFVANWGDGSEEGVRVYRKQGTTKQYYYEFSKIYEMPSTYTALICAYRPDTLSPSSVKQLAIYSVVVDSLTAQEPLPVLKVLNLSNFPSYNLFYLNVDDDGIQRSWTNKTLSAVVTFGNNILGYLSAAYSPAVSGRIGLSLSANQVFNQNWPLKTNLPFQIIERNNISQELSILFRGYIYVYETAVNSAILI